MKAWEIICSHYELDPPADLPRDVEIILIQAQVQGALTHEKGGYLWGTFSNAKNNVSYLKSFHPVVQMRALVSCVGVVVALGYYSLVESCRANMHAAKKKKKKFSLSYYVCLLYMNSRQHTTTVGILL